MDSGKAGVYLSLDRIFEKAAPSPSALIRGLREDGYDFINEAGNSFASCLVKPGGDEVVVVNIDPYCAEKFYQHCKNHPDNPYLPCVHDIKSFKGGCMVRMERLVALDHIELDAQDKAFLEKIAPAFVSFVRAETDANTTADMIAANPGLEKTARDILALSQSIYRESGGDVLAFCDLKPNNIFLRKTPHGIQPVFGDPLFPGAGKSEDNKIFMEAAYKRFGLPSLDESALAAQPSLQNA